MSQCSKPRMSELLTPIKTNGHFQRVYFWDTIWHTTMETFSFGYWVRRRRKALDWTQQKLAQQVGCAVTTIKKIEADERRPSRQLADLLVDALVIPAHERTAFLQSARGERSISALPVDQEPIKPRPVIPLPLPVYVNSFVGRERETADIQHLLQHNRLITLTGPGGIGKTRLGLYVAGQLAPSFPHGVHFIPLATIRDPARLLLAVAEALNISEKNSSLPLQQTILNHLRPQNSLLLFDNFEQIIEAAPLVSELLSAAPTLKIIITSRERLHLYGEQEYPVPPLAIPAPAAPSPEHIACESVVLFVQRTQAIHPHFRLTAENAQVIGEICARLDGLPLAIELAAARSKLFTSQALLTLLTDRLQTLTDGPRDAPGRQQTLRATIQWSYELLNSAEKALFARLAVFVNGWTVPAMMAILHEDTPKAETETPKEISPGATSSVLDIFSSLLNKSLIQQKIGTKDESRFIMLETIREFALEKLADSGEWQPIHWRHARYFAALAETAETHILGATPETWLNRLESDHANLRAALAWSLTATTENHAALGLRLAGALPWFWHFRSHWRDGRHWIEQILQHHPDGQPEQRAKTLCGAGLLAWAQADYQDAHTALTASLALLPTPSPHPAALIRAHALGLLGMVLWYEGKTADAMPYFSHSLHEYREIDNLFGTAVSLLRLGVANLAQGEWQPAILLHQESLSLYRQLQNTWGIALCLANLGEAYLTGGNWEQSAACYRESLQTMSVMGSQWYIALGIIGAAGLLLAAHQAENATQLLGAAARMVTSDGGHMPPYDQQLYERNLLAAQKQLDNPTFYSAWATGQAMPAEQVVQQAITTLGFGRYSPGD